MKIKQCTKSLLHTFIPPVPNINGETCSMQVSLLRDDHKYFPDEVEACKSTEIFSDVNISTFHSEPLQVSLKKILVGIPGNLLTVSVDNNQSDKSRYNCTIPILHNGTLFLTNTKSKMYSNVVHSDCNNAVLRKKFSMRENQLLFFYSSYQCSKTFFMGGKIMHNLQDSSKQVRHISWPYLFVTPKINL